MLRRLGFLFLLIGFAICSWSGYNWLNATSAVIVNEEQTKTINGDWADTAKQETLTYPLEDIKELPEQTAAIKSADKKEEKPVQPHFKTGEQVGELTIPKMGKAFLVYWGTDENTLMKGVGMYDSDITAIPGQIGHTVLAGHRDTVFIGLDQLKEGDRLYLEMDGITYEYQIRQIWITHADDRSVIVEKDKPTLTLTTCYPFDFIGSAPDRYIIQSELIGIEESY